MKTCFRCLQTKPVDDFYRHPRMADGRLGKCKECTRGDVIANRLKRLDYYREYDRNRASDEKRVAARIQYEQTPRWKEVKRKAGATWSSRHPNKRAAHSAVARAVRDGRMVRNPCEVCGTGDMVQAHHDDYDKPLDVRWLCTTHHHEHHKALRARQRDEERDARSRAA